MAREILNPRWANDQKTQIIANFKYDDGRQVVASITNIEGQPANPDWQEIMEKFGEKQVDANSQADLSRHLQKKQARSERQMIERERAAREVLFNTKAQIFDMEIVRNSNDRELKNLIRRASSVTEAQIYASVLHVKEMYLKPQQTETNNN